MRRLISLMILIGGCSPADGDRQDKREAGTVPTAVDAASPTAGTPLTATAGCALPAYQIMPGEDITLDWSLVTEDILGDPLDVVPATDGSALLFTFFDIVTTDDLLAACGVWQQEWIANSEYLHSDEEGALTRVLEAEQLPAAGGAAVVELFAHGQIVFDVYLLPDAGSTTVEVTL